jgi:hypothetical protein
MEQKEEVSNGFQVEFSIVLGYRGKGCFPGFICPLKGGYILPGLVGPERVIIARVNKEDRVEGVKGCLSMRLILRI